MKNIATALFFITVSLSLSPAQNRESWGPYHLYITDAIGNKDTLTLGWMDRPSKDLIQDIGEENIMDQPWDTVLEARIANRIDYFREPPRFHSKVYYANVALYDSPGVRRCPHSFGVPTIIIYAKYLPVEITWDSTFFYEDNCLRWVSLSNHDIWTEYSPFDSQAWEGFGADSLDNICMAEYSSYTTDLTPIRYGFSSFTYEYTFENGDTVTLGALAVVQDNIYSCDLPPIVNTVELPSSTISIYPNPTTDHVITLDAPDVSNIQSIRIRDIAGQVILDHRKDLPDQLDDYTISIPSQIQGLVIVQVVTGEGTWTEKVMVK